MAWSVSFYPQTVENYLRKSVIGLSFDYQILNLLGFACYAVFNVTTFFNTKIRDEYKEANGDNPTVEANDVFFALHAVMLTTITLIQIYIYDRGNQVFANWSKIATLLFSIFIVIYAVICAFSDSSVRAKSPRSWLAWSTSLSIIKLIISIAKYVPQVYLNHTRRSTVGWSIGNVLLDFTGGVLSVFQAFWDCSLSGDWSGISGDPVKFGLGFISIIFDVIFMVQHYVLFPQDGSINNNIEDDDCDDSNKLVVDDDNKNVPLLSEA